MTELPVKMNTLAALRAAGVVRFSCGAFTVVFEPSPIAPIETKQTEDPNPVNSCGHPVGSSNGGLCWQCVEQGPQSQQVPE